MYSHGAHKPMHAHTHTDNHLTEILPVFYVQEYFASMHVCVPHACSAYRSQKASHPLGQTEEMGVSFHVGAENQMQVPCKSKY